MNFLCSFSEYTLLPLVFALGGLQPAQLLRCRPDQLHLQTVLQTGIDDSGIVRYRLIIKAK